MGDSEPVQLARVPPPVVGLEKLVRGISERVGRALERQGLLVRDFESSFLTLDLAEVSGFDDLLGHSITYRIALGPSSQGRKAFTLQTWLSGGRPTTLFEGGRSLRRSMPFGVGVNRGRLAAWPGFPELSDPRHGGT